MKTPDDDELLTFSSIAMVIVTLPLQGFQLQLGWSVFNGIFSKKILRRDEKLQSS